MEIDRRLSRDRKRARITVPVSAFDVEVEGLKDIIAALAALRSAMLPAEPLEFVPPKNMAAVAEPGLTVEPELWDGEVLFHLRDPGFGWLHFALSKPLAERLGTHLLALARLPGKIAGKPN